MSLGIPNYEKGQRGKSNWKNGIANPGIDIEKLIEGNAIFSPGRLGRDGNENVGIANPGIDSEKLIEGNAIFSPGRLGSDGNENEGMLNPGIVREKLIDGNMSLKQHFTIRMRIQGCNS